MRICATLQEITCDRCSICSAIGNLNLVFHSRVDHVNVEHGEVLLDACHKHLHRVQGKRGKGGTRGAMAIVFDWVSLHVKGVHFRDNRRNLVSQFVSYSVAAGVLASRLVHSRLQVVAA